jgi:hypothetical protein
LAPRPIAGDQADFLKRQQRFADRFDELIAEREAPVTLAPAMRETMARAGRIRARQNLPPSALSGRCESTSSSPSR